jgi:V/A-type H+-transporting ATPase subunit A
VYELEGKIIKVVGPVAVAEGLKEARIWDIVLVGELELFGEIIGLEKNIATIEVYEDTTSLKVGEKVVSLKKPLTAELGPGMLGSIYDGLQKSLIDIKNKRGDYIERGVKIHKLSRDEKWEFIPTFKKNDDVKYGQVIGYVMEFGLKHKILSNFSGKVTRIEKGKFRVDETIAVIDKKEQKLYQEWPIKIPRPCKEKIEFYDPLVTGQRVIDTLFPMAKGGICCVPGAFGTGKTVLEHVITMHADTDVIIFVGCGERGNEMCDLITTLLESKDQKIKKGLMEKTILIANTSNMPVIARKTSIFTGVTIGEYFRDQGYNVLLLADSISRWAEAMREVSGRLKEIPGEEGYPVYLQSEMANFYERAGRIKTHDGNGSLTLICSVSPPGGDFSEPVTQAALRVAKVFWGLDIDLAYRRHFPSINWLISYSLYTKTLDNWYEKKISKEWISLRNKTLELLKRENELERIVRIVGIANLPVTDVLVLDVTRLIREEFLQQNAFHPIDSYCSLKKQFEMLKSIITFYDLGIKALEKNIPIKKILDIPAKQDLIQMKFSDKEEFSDLRKEIEKELEV